MPVSDPIKFSEDEVQKGVDAVKFERPDIWARWIDHEKKDEGYQDIDPEITGILRKLFPELQSGNLFRLKFLVRVEVRRAAGRPV